MQPQSLSVESRLPCNEPSRAKRCGLSPLSHYTSFKLNQGWNHHLGLMLQHTYTKQLVLQYCIDTLAIK